MGRWDERSVVRAKSLVSRETGGDKGEKYSSLAPVMVGRVGLRSAVFASLVALVACGSRSSTGPGTPVYPTAQDPFAGANCSLVKPPVEPELMAWDPSLRAQLDKLRRQHVVAVRYEAKGCDVSLELLADCIGPKNKYVYSPMASASTRVARNVDELLAQLPLGASSISTSLRVNESIRADFRLVGAVALPPGSTVTEYDLVGSTCKGATHVISAVYIGGFGIAHEPGAGETNAFTGGAVAIAREGYPAICERAATEGIPLDGCSAPLRVALTPLNGAVPPPTCPENWTFDGKKCVKGAAPAPVCSTWGGGEPEPGCGADAADGGAADPSGVFDQANVERVVRVKSANTKRNCWETAPASVHSFSANIATTIDAQGKVVLAEPQLVAAEGPSDVANIVARCIANDVLTWEFPAPGAPTTVVLPFHLLRQ